jgi:hypothetical protein
MRTILRREGVGGLYKGLLPNVLRVMPQSAITFLVYEKVMELLESPACKDLEPPRWMDFVRRDES